MNLFEFSDYLYTTTRSVAVFGFIDSCYSLRCCFVLFINASRRADPSLPCWDVITGFVGRAVHFITGSFYYTCIPEAVAMSRSDSSNPFIPSQEIRVLCQSPAEFSTLVRCVI